MMMRRLGDLALVLLVCAAAACGGGGSGGGGGDSGTDTTPGDGQLSEFCLENPGAECDDDDPCTLGMGICISGECAFDETTDCGPAPDSCSSDPVCDGEGGCIWVLSPGWCRIDGECRQDGETSADNACLLCDP
ncbi:MAG: hypothetical protein FJ098_15800, partial [Deltaproteobacteria bacterium]|nr:hypothetical protein [Deltaproteobacteria bacterium]